MELYDLMFALLDFSLALVLFLSIALFSPFEIGLSMLCYYMSAVLNFLFDVYKLQFALNLNGDSGLGLLSNARTMKTWATLQNKGI